MATSDTQYSFERSLLWRTKVRLQHTGWLHYVPPIILGSISLLLSRVFAWRFHAPFADVITSSLASFGKLLLVVGIFDILTIKLNVFRPLEPLPKRLDGDMKGIACSDICSVIRERRSCRSFQPRKLRQEDRDEIHRIAGIESKRTLSSAQIRFEYVDCALKVWPVVNAQEFLVAIGPAKYDRMAMIDVGRSLQAVVLHATKMGIATCWIGPGADHLSVTTALKMRNKYSDELDHVVCVCAIGYKSVLVPTMVRLATNAMSRSRKPCKELFFSDHSFQKPLDVSTYPFVKFAKCYEAARWSPSSFNAQPTKCVGRWDETTDIVWFDFFSTTNSRYYAPIAAGIWLRDWESACESIGVKGQFIVLPQKEPDVDSPHGSSSPLYNISWTAH